VGNKPGPRQLQGIINDVWPKGAWERRTAAISKLREFSETLPNSCTSEITQQFRRNPKLWHQVTPTYLERLVADIFRENYRHAEVFHVGQPSDGGIDVLFVDAEREQWLIQVKRKSKAESTEGVATIRNLLGAMVLNRSKFGIVVSTPDHFSYQALRAVDQVKQEGMALELVDRGKLYRMMLPLLPSDPWLDFVELHFPHLLEEHFFEAQRNRKQLRQGNSQQSHRQRRGIARRFALRHSTRVMAGVMSIYE
jgi:hypothetical protein